MVMPWSRLYQAVSDLDPSNTFHDEQTLGAQFRDDLRREHIYSMPKCGP
jgi:hypothetical protein